MNILFAVDKNYLIHLYTTINSIVINNKIKINFYILYSDLDEIDIRKLEKYINNSGNKLISIHVKSQMFNNASVLSYISITTYYRLLIMDILPKEVDKILYLDVDIVVNGDITKLYNINMNHNYIGAVQDRPDSKKSNLRNIKRLGIEEKYKYINAGVILFDIENMRSNINNNEYMKFLNNVLKLDLVFADQDIINLFFKDKIMYLPEIYNYRPRLFSILNIKKPVIIHYYGWIKPWNPQYFFSYKTIYYKYAESRISKKSSFFISSVYKCKFILNESRIISKNIYKKVINSKM